MPATGASTISPNWGTKVGIVSSAMPLHCSENPLTPRSIARSQRQAVFWGTFHCVFCHQYCRNTPTTERPVLSAKCRAWKILNTLSLNSGDQFMTQRASNSSRATCAPRFRAEALPGFGPHCSQSRTMSFPCLISSGKAPAKASMVGVILFLSCSSAMGFPTSPLTATTIPETTSWRKRCRIGLACTSSNLDQLKISLSTPAPLCQILVASTTLFFIYPPAFFTPSFERKRVGVNRSKRTVHHIIFPAQCQCCGKQQKNNG